MTEQRKELIIMVPLNRAVRQPGMHVLSIGLESASRHKSVQAQAESTKRGSSGKQQSLPYEKSFLLWAQQAKKKGHLFDTGNTRNIGILNSSQLKFSGLHPHQDEGIPRLGVGKDY